MFPQLVELCLNSVAENLGRHHLLFTTSEDFYTKRKLEFLQKKYSWDLMSRVCAKDGLPEEFIDILVNKYTKFLDTSWFQKCSLDRLTSKLAEIGCNLEKIVCSHESVKEGFSEAINDSVCHFTHLKSFTFPLECDDWILKNVAKFCRNIEEIYMENSAITSEGVRYLCSDKNGKLLCTTLKKLCFGESKFIENEDVEYLLKNLPSLEIMDHPRLPEVLYALHKENLPSLDKVSPYNITTLNFLSYYDFIDDIIKVCVSVCPRLKNVSCFLREQEQLSQLFDLPDLEQLHITGFKTININSFIISKGSCLTSLCIWQCTVSVSVLAENCPCLKELILRHAIVLGDEDSKPVFSSLSSLTFVQYNILSSLYVMTMKLMLSSSLIKLESLSFKKCYLESRELQVAILKCCELNTIKNIAFDTFRIKKEKKFIKDVLHICRTLDYLILDDPVDYGDREDWLSFAERLPNKPKISIGHWIPPVWLDLLNFGFLI